MEIITEKLTNSPNLEGSREPTDVFQRDFVRGVVSEAMQEWCDGVEKRMWGQKWPVLRFRSDCTSCWATAAVNCSTPATIQLSWWIL